MYLCVIEYMPVFGVRVCIRHMPVFGSSCVYLCVHVCVWWVGW